jgi:endonuclease/exonuclease/phosphatase (EEP) superfamily protein YafD
MIRRFLDALVPVVVAGAFLVIAWPGLVHLEQTPGVAQLASFRVAAAGAGVALLAMCLVTAAGSRRSRRMAITLALVCALFVAVQAIVVTDRGTSGSPPTGDRGAGEVTVLSWNTLGGAPGAEAVADLARQNAADVVTLPETTREFGDQVAALLAEQGTAMQVFTVAFDEISKARSTTLLVSDRLGDYRLDDSRGSTGQLPSVTAVPTSGNGPSLVAVHAVAPVSSEFDTWRDDLGWAAGTCRGDTIMAGDFNSTIDHWTHLVQERGAVLGTCGDAAQQHDSAAVGTWPTTLPPLLGTPIDHVLATGQWAATSFVVLTEIDTAGSDHRPVVATLSRTTAPGQAGP